MLAPHWLILSLINASVHRPTSLYLDPVGSMSPGLRISDGVTAGLRGGMRFTSCQRICLHKYRMVHVVHRLIQSLPRMGHYFLYHQNLTHQLLTITQCQLASPILQPGLQS